MSTEILDVVALSPLQRGLYSVSTMSHGVDPYLVTFVVRIENLAEVSTLRTAFDHLLDRYPQLGGAVLADGLPHPVLVMTSAGRIAWHEVDLRRADDPDAAAGQLYREEGRRRIDLDSGPLFRVTVARVGEHAYEMICTAHHIIIDGWSIPLLFADLIALHRGEGATLPSAPPLREHAAWLASRDTTASIRAWTAALADLTPMPMIAAPAPADIPALGEARLGRGETELVTNWARGRGLTINTVLQMAWARVLSGLTGRDDVVFGQTTSGRDASLPNAERLVGALVTTIPVRVRLDERSPADLGTRLQRDVAQLRPHEYLGIAEITRQAGAGQLFDTLLVFENTPIGSITAEMPIGAGATLTPRRIDSPSHYPLAVVPVIENGELITRVEIRPDLVTRFDPDRLARRMLAVVRRIVDVARCCDVDLLLEDETAVLGRALKSEGAPSFLPGPGSGADADSADLEWDPAFAGTGEPTAGTMPTTVQEALLAVADGAADRIAVIDESGEQSFIEFGSAVRALAEGLRAAGLRRGDAVAVVLPRDRRVLHAPFAIGHAGGLCVHVDPATPADRLAYILGSAEVRVVLGDESLGEALDRAREQGIDVRHAIPDHAGGLRLTGQPTATHDAPHATSDTPFYVVFTSGTTGRPKGVAVPHRALLNHWSNHERRIFAPAAARTGRPLRVGHGWSTGFDAAWQPTVALLSGHTVVLLGDKVRTDAEQIVAAIERHRIDIFDTSPSMLSRLIVAGLFTERDGTPHCPLTVLALGGEAISSDTWQRLQGLPTTRVINFYGPTETTVEALMADVHDHPAPTIGRPFDGMTAEVLDHRLRPVPPGGQGELYLSGAQLALGYLGRPGATAAAFVAGSAGRRYRTGDLVLRVADQTVVYEGRIDSQVKINGYRVEPGEATVVLRELDGVRHAAALAFVENGRTKLGALVVAERSVTEIRSELARRLPQFLVPSRIVHVDEIPLNRNDKLDVHAATALLAGQAAGTAVAEPATDTERALLGLIAAMGESGTGHCGRARILDTLVDLGVDSIGVMDLVSRLRGSGYRVAAKDILAAADLRDLARRLDELSPLGHGESAAEVTPVGTVLPLAALAHEIIANGNFRYLSHSQVISLPDGVSVDEIADRLEALATAHPTLRSRLDSDAEGRPVLVVEESSSAAALLSVVAENPTDNAKHLRDTVERLNPEAGHMIAATVLEGVVGDGANGRGPVPRRLLLSIHHLAVDVVSWLVLIDDLRRLDRGLRPINEELTQDISTVAPTSGAEILGAPIGGRFTDPATDRAGNAIQRVVELGPDRTEYLLARCADTEVPLEDVLIMACVLTFHDSVDDTGRVAVTRESHGRSAEDDTRRVGWFNIEETILVLLAHAQNWTARQGRPFLTDRTLDARGQLRVNHLGRFDVLQSGDGPWVPVPMSDFTAEFGIAPHPDLPQRFTAEISTVVIPRGNRPSLVAQFDINSAVLDDAEADARISRWSDVLSGFVEDRLVAARP
ncbi:AMP-binding protein [Nocardia sp. NBC_01730]|uniref:non-ribosomal peptide synthetase n=1 Tax=Nocardia sp. NBC_01730 TaxID=2975998 RepID=UPI002E1574C9|nr:AMP-binding protein [Nocardia sp. NBC_01730]